MPGLSPSRALAQQQRRRLAALTNLPLASLSLAMSQTLEKTALVEKLDGSRTAHLQPVIDFLKAQGNVPATGDEFYYNRDGYGIYGFAQPFDVARLRERFEFPATMQLTESTVFDSRNFVSITQDAGPRRAAPLSFPA